MNQNLLFAFAAAALLLAPAAQATLIDHHAAATDGADRLLEVQLDSGAMPWIVGDDREFQNVQGVSAIGLVDAFTVTGNLAYLGEGTDGAAGVANWLIDYVEDDPEAFLSSGNFFFLAKYGLLTADTDAINAAQASLDVSTGYYDDGDESNGGPAADMARAIIEFRANSAWTNLGLWDVGLFVRGAQDIGATEAADEMADVLATQTIADPFDEDANAYEIGLSGIVFGLSEADALAYQDPVAEAKSALLASQCEDGSFPITWNGEVFCGDVQTTAYAAYALTHALDLAPAAQSACDFLAASQAENGGWDLDGEGYEIAEIDSEAVMALVACIAPVHNGATSYADAAVGLV